jgi:hypothetical protein
MFALSGGSMKSGMYRLRKWYFDFLTPRLDYCYVYYADVSILGITFRFLTLHLARPGVGVQTTKSLPVGRAEEQDDGEAGRSFRFSGGQVLISDDTCTIDVSAPGCSARLKYEPLNPFRGQPVVIRTRGDRRILWRPLHVKDRVTGSMVLDGEAIEVLGFDGYVDYLESWYPPPLVPVRTLCWGRLHHPEIDLVYTQAANGRGSAAWSSLSACAGDSVIECGEVAIVNSPAAPGSAPDSIPPAGYEVKASSGACRVHLNVRHAAAIQESSFIDHQQMKSAVARYILKKLTRNPRGTKWLSYADVILEEAGTKREFRDVPMIDEFALL